MSILVRTIRIDLETRKSSIIKEEVVDGEYHADDVLLRYFAEDCMKKFRKEQESASIIKKDDYS